MSNVTRDILVIYVFLVTHIKKILCRYRKIVVHGRLELRDTPIDFNHSNDHLIKTDRPILSSPQRSC